MTTPTRLSLGLILTTALSVSFVQLTAAADIVPTWKAGAAKVVITPGQFMWMAGYGARNRPADGKLSDLWAKALVLQDPQGRQAVLVTLDLVGIDRGLSQRICGDLETECKLVREQIALATSHTHSGPVVAENLRPMHYLLLDEAQRKLVDEYAQSLRKKVVGIVKEAQSRLAPSRVEWGSGMTTFAVNRRNNDQGNVPALRASGQLVGPVDYDVPVLAVRDPSGNLTAVAFGYACHATVLSGYQWCADYPGYAQTELETKHPDCVALFWAGCGADQNPLPRREVALAQEYGRRLAQAVEDVLGSAMRPVAGELSTSYHEIDVPFGELPSREKLTGEAASSNKFLASRAQSLLAQIDAGKPLSATYPYPVALWRIGDEVQLVILGGEVVVDYALRLKGELAGKQTWVAGYANDVMAYIPSRRVLTEGGYEGGGAMVYYGLPTIWSPQVEETIVKEVHRQVKAASE